MIRLRAGAASAAIGLRLAMSFHTPAMAQQYTLNGTTYESLQDCENALKRHGVEGSLAGGAAGALLGTSVSGHNHGIGAGLGGVAGATVGGRVADHGTCTPVHTVHHY